MRGAGRGGASFTRVPHPQHLLEDARGTFVGAEIGEKEEEKKERKEHASHQGRDGADRNTELLI